MPQPGFRGAAEPSLVARDVGAGLSRRVSRPALAAAPGPITYFSGPEDSVVVGPAVFCTPARALVSQAEEHGR